MHLLEPAALAADQPGDRRGRPRRGRDVHPAGLRAFGSKAALAMLSDQRNRHLFTAAELASLDRILPWTRMVRPGPVTLEDGQTGRPARLRPARPGRPGAQADAAHSGRAWSWLRPAPRHRPAIGAGQFGRGHPRPVRDPAACPARVPELFPDDRGELMPLDRHLGSLHAGRGPWRGLHPRGHRGLGGGHDQHGTAALSSAAACPPGPRPCDHRRDGRAARVRPGQAPGAMQLIGGPYSARRREADQQHRDRHARGGR